MLAQWYATAAYCPATPVRSTVARVLPLTIKVTRNDLDPALLPLRQNAVAVETAQAQTLHSLGIVQVSGRYLNNV